MRIGIDAKRAFQNYTGLGNYSRELIRGLIKQFHQEEYFLFTPRTSHQEFTREISAYKNVHVITPGSSSFSSLWRSYGITKLIKKLNLDVYHGLSNELPLNIAKAPVKKIVTVHDLIPYKEDAFRNIYDDYFFKLKIKSAVKNADQVIAISKSTATDLEQVLHVPAKKIQVIYPPVHCKPFTENAAKELPAGLQLPPVFILQVGRVEYRKNIQVVLDAMIALKHPSFHYVVVGKKTGFYTSLQAYAKNMGIADKVHFIDPVTDRELDALYQKSSLVVYPSLYEGFGLPVVEAICRHKPVLATAGGCFEEAGGEGAFYCDTSDPVKVGAAIEKILSMDTAGHIRKGLAHLTRFDPAAAAASLMDCYKR